ncbi:hypothetical protein BGX27_011421 [Mortierella sp. AM989]|nr:hypothetical protein BGX27_011421 [Mortierella sp. AM989]
MHRKERCCWCIPFRIATFLGGFILAVLGGAGSYIFFTNRDLPNRSIEVGGMSIQPLTSSQSLWYYVAAVSVLAAAAGLFGMFSALSANRRAVKAFEAFYFFSLMTQLALIIWGLIWCKQNQREFDTICNASKDGQVDLPIPGFTSSWTCQKIYMAGILTIGIGGIIWVAFNFFMTNRVIHYARELFNEKANRYKVLGEAAAKELDREQQIPLNYTNVGSSMKNQEHHNNRFEQPSYRDEIEYKDPRSDDSFQHSQAAAGIGAYGKGLPQHHQQSVAPGFNRRSSTQGLDLVNPYHGEQETFQGNIAMESTSAQSSHQPVPYHAQGSGQSFVHASTSKIPSPFGDEEPIAPVNYSSQDDIKVPLPASPREVDILSPTEQAPPKDMFSPTMGSSSGSK